MSENFPELTQEEITTSLDLTPALQGVIDYINAMNYLSELRAFRHALPRVAKINKFNEGEVDVIVERLKKRELELSAKSIGHAITDEQVVDSKEWRPSDVLDAFTSTSDEEWKPYKD